MAIALLIAKSLASLGVGKMKRNDGAVVGAALFAGLVMVGSAFCLGNSCSMKGEHSEKQNQIVRRSVIKVHTDRGVITLPGRADSWDAVEYAEFVADSLADVQMVNNQVSMFSKE
jgi:osmotically-inducible protein OsmY